MIPLILLLLHFLLYGISPILIVTIFHKFKSISFFYSYFGFLFVFTQLFAVFYSIKISEDLFITGGNIAYSSITLITVNIVSSLVFIIEVLLLFYTLEKIKDNIKKRFTIISLYLIIFIGKIWVQDRIKGDHSKGSIFIVLIPEVKHI